jgi:hypothetical protein
MRTHANGGRIYKTTSNVVACSTQFGMALACPMAVAHIKEHCKEVGATPETPMKSAFILSASSRDQVLKGISTMRIPEYEVGSSSGSATGEHDTESEEGDRPSGRLSPPSGKGSQGDEDEPGPGLDMGSYGDGGGASNIDYGGGSLRLQIKPRRLPPSVAS